jgi:hypothetical protein
MSHRCEKNANTLRDETDMLRFEFNSRLTEICIRTVESVYINFVLTRLCLPAHLNVREGDYVLYFSSSFVCSFLAFWVYHMPLSFLLTLSRNAEHLGEWTLESVKSKESAVTGNDQPLTASSACKWLHTRVYYKDERVVYFGKIYRVSSTCTAAVPNNKKYRKFFRFFSNPFRIVCMLLMLKLANLAMLATYTAFNKRWYSILTNLVEILFNCHTFFIIFRDFFLFISNKDNMRNLKYTARDMENLNSKKFE